MEASGSQVNLADGEQSHTIVAKIDLSPGLYVVATPIGNLRDVTLRALDVLASANLILCEDTRVTKRLLERYRITTPLGRYDDHSGDRDRDAILGRLAAGEAVALASDAGTPLVSDPGFKLARAVIEAGHAVVPVPGASAPLAALTAAGLPTDSFFFGGFLPEKSVARQKTLAALLGRGETVIVFESARRLPDALADAAAVDPERRVIVARELTKRFEEFVRGPASELADKYRKEGPPKGEVVLLFAPAPAPESGQAETDAALRDALRHLSTKEAATAVAYLTGARRRDLYQRALELAGEKDG